MSGRFRLSFVNAQPKNAIHGQRRHDRHAFGSFNVTLDHSALASSHTMVRRWATAETRPTYWHDTVVFKVLNRNRKHEWMHVIRTLSLCVCALASFLETKQTRLFK